jgi:hypothetical protein
MARYRWLPPVVASSTGARILLATAPWDGVDQWEELELDAAMEQSGFKVLHTLSEEAGPGLLSMLFPPAKAPNVLQNPRTPAKMKCCVTTDSGYYPPVEEGLFWILCAYIEVYTWTTIKTN